MQTELEIVYGIIEAIKDSNFNNDINTGERYIRSLLRTSRANNLRIFYNNGETVSDEVKQFKRISFKSVSGLMISDNFPKAADEYVADIPKMIELSGYGSSLDLAGVPIPIIASHDYHLSKHDPFQKKLIFAKRNLKKIHLHVPSEADCVKEGPSAFIRNHIFDPTNGSGSRRTFKLDLYGIFDNPDDADDYNWETDPWPFPSERFEQFYKDLLRTQFGIMGNAKKDEVQNNREDQIRYHDNTDVNSAT